MGKHILKLEHNGTPYYLEYSTALDAPLTQGMPKDAFVQWYLKEYGEVTAQGLEVRLRRVEQKGTSSLWAKDVEDTLRNNDIDRVVNQDTIRKMIETYCLNTPQHNEKEIAKDEGNQSEARQVT